MESNLICGRILSVYAQYGIVSSDYLDKCCRGLLVLDTFFNSERLGDVHDDLSSVFTVGMGVEFRYVHMEGKYFHRITKIGIVEDISDGIIENDEAYVKSIEKYENGNSKIQLSTLKNGIVDLVTKEILVHPFTLDSLGIGYVLRIKLITSHNSSFTEVSKVLISVRPCANKSEEFEAVGLIISTLNNCVCVEINTVGILYIPVERFKEFDLKRMFGTSATKLDILLIGKKLTLKLIPNFPDCREKFVVLEFGFQAYESIMKKTSTINPYAFLSPRDLFVVEHYVDYFLRQRLKNPSQVFCVTLHNLSSHTVKFAGQRVLCQLTYILPLLKRLPSLFSLCEDEIELKNTMVKLIESVSPDWKTSCPSIENVEEIQVDLTDRIVQKVVWFCLRYIRSCNSAPFQLIWAALSNTKNVEMIAGVGSSDALQRLLRHHSDIFSISDSGVSLNKDAEMTLRSRIDEMPEEVPQSSARSSRDRPNLRLFVGGLAQTTVAKHLYDCFSNYGDMDDCFVVPSEQSDGSSKFGFVQFRTLNAMNSALNAQPVFIDGVRIRAVPAEKRSGFDASRLKSKPARCSSSGAIANRVFIGGLSETTTTKMLHEHFSTFGTLVECYMVPVKCVGFMAYQTEEEALTAMDHTHNIDGRSLRASPAFAKPVATVPSPVSHSRKLQNDPENELANFFARFISQRGGQDHLQSISCQFGHMTDDQRTMVHGSMGGLKEFLQRFPARFSVSHGSGSNCMVSLVSQHDRIENQTTSTSAVPPRRYIERDNQASMGPDLSLAIVSLYVDFLSSRDATTASLHILSTKFGLLTREQRAIVKSMEGLELFLSRYPDVFKLTGRGMECNVSLVSPEPHQVPSSSNTSASSNYVEKDHFHDDAAGTLNVLNFLRLHLNRQNALALSYFVHRFNDLSQDGKLVIDNCEAGFVRFIKRHSDVLLVVQGHEERCVVLLDVNDMSSASSSMPTFMGDDVTVTDVTSNDIDLCYRTSPRDPSPVHHGPREDTSLIDHSLRHSVPFGVNDKQSAVSAQSPRGTTSQPHIASRGSVPQKPILTALPTCQDGPIISTDATVFDPFGATWSNSSLLDSAAATAFVAQPKLPTSVPSDCNINNIPKSRLVESVSMFSDVLMSDLKFHHIVARKYPGLIERVLKLRKITAS